MAPFPGVATYFSSKPWSNHNLLSYLTSPLTVAELPPSSRKYEDQACLSQLPPLPLTWVMMVSSRCTETFPDSRDLNFPTEVTHMIPGISWLEGPVSCKYLGVPILWQCGWFSAPGPCQSPSPPKTSPLHPRPLEHSWSTTAGPEPSSRYHGKGKHTQNFNKVLKGDCVLTVWYTVIKDWFRRAQHLAISWEIRISGTRTP